MQFPALEPHPPPGQCPLHLLVPPPICLKHMRKCTCTPPLLDCSGACRWCVTGTPVGPGGLQDIFGLLKVLQYSPFDDPDVFR